MLELGRIFKSIGNKKTPLKSVFPCKFVLHDTIKLRNHLLSCQIEQGEVGLHIP